MDDAMRKTMTAAHRCGAGSLAALLLVITTLSVLAICPASCCEPGAEMTIGRAMACCEMPTVSERERDPAPPARTANLTPSAPLVLHLGTTGADLDTRSPRIADATTNGDQRRLHAPLFLINAQFRI